MTIFRRLALAATLSTFILVAIGGLVRATKSGLGCGTDWPHCSGKLVPALESRAVIIEYSHRLAASVVVILLATLALAAWRLRPRSRRIAWASSGAFGLVLLQAVIGAVVVKLELEAESVVLHLTAAMALLGVLIYITLGAYRIEDRLETTVDRATAKRASFAAGAVLLLLMVGSYISGSPGAGLAFGDWPLMNGRVVPDLSVEPRALHFLHRTLAAASGAVVAVVALQIMRRKAELPLQAHLAHVALGAFALEVLIGAANVWTGLNAVVVTGHLLVGALVWASLVGIAVASRPATLPVAHRTLRGRRPALDGGR
ncbi:MAG: heme A synthase [Actinomycetota bacterium]